MLAPDGVTPTLAGLLAFGRYPQQFLPQAMITFAVYPGKSKNLVVGDTRMLDRRGIWGERRVIDLFDGSSRSRNGVLAALLADAPLPDRDEAVSENAGSGIPAMTGALGRAGLPAPRFDATVMGVKVTLDGHGLLIPKPRHGSAISVAVI